MIKIDKNELMSMVEKASLVSDSITIVIKERELTMNAASNSNSVEFKTRLSSNADDVNFKIMIKPLLAILRKDVPSKGNIISIETFPNHILVKNGRLRLKIEKLMEIDPVIKAQAKTELDVPVNFIDTLKKISYAIDKNSHLPALAGVLVKNTKGRMFFVSTDAKRMAIVETTNNNEDFSMIISQEAIKIINKIYGHAKLTIKKGENTLSIQAYKISFETKLINAKYPNFERIIPSSALNSINISSSMFEKLVEEASIMNNEIIIETTGTELKLCDINHTTEVKEQFQSAKILFAVNASAILQFIKSLEDDEKQIRLDFNATNSPIVLSSGFRKEIIMPVVYTVDEDVEEKEAA